MKLPHALATLLPLLFATYAHSAPPATMPDRRPFIIEVVDEQTGRGVPLIELRTTDNVRYITDSAGIVAVEDPTLFGRRAWFGISGHGYEYPADGFGSRGKAFDVRPGAAVAVKIKRTNIAQRLYRITGAGIYHDSILAGRPVPLREPLLNAQVTGQDSALAVVYRGKVRWFWGDTNRVGYPLGQFWTSGATSLLPRDGGLNPSVGIDLTYFTAPDGFSRPMLERVNSMPKWLDGLCVVKDEAGNERMVGLSSTMKDLGTIVAKEMVIYDDEKDVFTLLAKVPLDRPLIPTGHPFRAAENGVDYLYFPVPFPLSRVRADLKSLQDPAAYEAYTCLARGSRWMKGKVAEMKVERDEKSAVVWSWKPDTAPLRSEELRALLKANKLKPEEVPYLPRDIETKQVVWLHQGGSVNYNPFRKKFILIAVESGGKPSFLGEVWYAEADQPQGPWLWARKIVSHDKYSLYNPVHHTFYDADGGRTIHFQGTYSYTFSREGDPTQRYDYNQVMYQVDLADPRLTGND